MEKYSFFLKYAVNEIIPIAVFVLYFRSGTVNNLHTPSFLNDIRRKRSQFGIMVFSIPM